MKKGLLGGIGLAVAIIAGLIQCVVKPFASAMGI